MAKTHILAVACWHSPLITMDPTWQGGPSPPVQHPPCLSPLCMQRGCTGGWHVAVARGSTRDPCQPRWQCPSHVVTHWGSTWHPQGPGWDCWSLPIAVGMGEAIDSAGCSPVWWGGPRWTLTAPSSRDGLEWELMLGKRGAEHPWGWMGCGVLREPILQWGCGCGREERCRV